MLELNAARPTIADVGLTSYTMGSSSVPKESNHTAIIVAGLTNEKVYAVDSWARF